jgi:hypothetical protein
MLDDMRLIAMLPLRYPLRLPHDFRCPVKTESPQG